MPKKATIIINLLPEASNSSIIQIENKIRNEASIPLCMSIEKIAIEDINATYRSWEKQGISNKVARALMELYTQ
jgi:hypothetical protein